MLGLRPVKILAYPRIVIKRLVSIARVHLVELFGCGRDPAWSRRVPVTTLRHGLSVLPIGASRFCQMGPNGWKYPSSIQVVQSSVLASHHVSSTDDQICSWSLLESCVMSLPAFSTQGGPGKPPCEQHR